MVVYPNVTDQSLLYMYCDDIATVLWGQSRHIATMNCDRTMYSFGKLQVRLTETKKKAYKGAIF